MSELRGHGKMSVSSVDDQVKIEIVFDAGKYNPQMGVRIRDLVSDMVSGKVDLPIGVSTKTGGFDPVTGEFVEDLPDMEGDEE